MSRHADHQRLEGFNLEQLPRSLKVDAARREFTRATPRGAARHAHPGHHSGGVQPPADAPHDKYAAGVAAV